MQPISNGLGGSDDHPVQAWNHLLLLGQVMSWAWLHMCYQVLPHLGKSILFQKY